MRREIAWKWIRRSAICLTPLLIGACQSGSTSDPCAGFTAFRPDPATVKGMTERDKRWVLEYDQHGADTCGWKP